MKNRHEKQGQRAFHVTRAGRVAWAVGLCGSAWLVACSSQDTSVDPAGESAPVVKSESVGDAPLAAPAPAKWGSLRQADALHYDISAPFSTLRASKEITERRTMPLLHPAPVRSLAGLPAAAPEFHADALSLDPAAPTAGVNFEGIGQGFTGPAGTFNVFYAPPDPNGAVGPNHYMEIVNAGIAVFNKSGTPVFGPVATNTLWSGFGGPCETDNDGDGTVNYDRMADRWVVAQFALTTPFMYCVAVSTSADPTGSYARYAFTQTNFPDYPKLGVWPDAYYATFNQFNSSGTAFLGPEVCAYDRAKMLAGQPATQECITLSTSYSSLLPANQDGPTLPPTGSPNPLVSLDPSGTGLDVWKFHADFVTPANATLTGPTVLPVSAYTPACGGGTCIPQPGESTQLDSLGERLMNRVSYRNFGDHQALVVNHSIVAGSSTGTRWYEVRDPVGTPTLFQQGTVAPDSNFRWMGSAALNGQGSIGIGYSVSSSTVFPSVAVTGRLASDPAGTTPQGELTLISGTGVQNGGLSRWGDYTDMTVDPTDDCTFWYVNQYQATTGSFNWHTRVGSFKIGSCATGVNQPPVVNAGPDVTITLPAAANLAGTASDDGLPNPPGVLTITWAKVSGPGTVTFANPAVATTTATFSAAGTYVLSLTGNDSALSSSDTVTVVVNPAVMNQPPVVNAGPDQTITLPAAANLTGTATDDGLPNPPGHVTTTWAKVSGPGTVTFANASALSTTATFSAAGTYVLSLTGNDSLLSATDTIQIVVNPAGGGNPCDGLCTNPINFTINGSFQSGNIGTNAVCYQTKSVVHGGNCGNFQFPRTLRVNGVLETCNNLNWASVPPPRNGGWCYQATAGNWAWAFITAW